VSPEQIAFLAASFALVAALYSSVGHAGASGYLAMMAIAGLSPGVMRPTALSVNILVAAFTVQRFRQAGYVRWRNLWPFLLGSVPLAAFGGSLSLGTRTYYWAVAVVLALGILAIVTRDRLLRSDDRAEQARIPILPAIAIGAAIGMLSGLTGTGGGIFLSPVVVLLGWAGLRTTAGISAPFILANSAVALAAGWGRVGQPPAELPILAAAAFGGAIAGTWLGLKRLPTRGLVIALALVMAMAALKLVLTA
jgi:uncharacterized membrane protein YfcA